MMKILKVLQFDAKSSIKQYFLNTLSVKRNIYRVVEWSNCRWALLEVWKFGFRFTATIRIALENRSLVDSRVYSVTFKTLTSIIFQTEYSIALLHYILSSTRPNLIAKDRKIRLKNFEGRPLGRHKFKYLNIW